MPVEHRPREASVKKMLMSAFLILCSVAAGFGQETRLVIQSTHTGTPASIGALAISEHDEYLVTGGLDIEYILG